MGRSKCRFSRAPRQCVRKPAITERGLASPSLGRRSSLSQERVLRISLLLGFCPRRFGQELGDGGIEGCGGQGAREESDFAGLIVE